MTTKLYYDNVYQKEFTAKVVGVRTIEDKFGIILDQTCFYPEGGGQYGDVGWLDDVPVIDTQKVDGEILHLTKTSIDVGAEVYGKLNWKIRFEKMQNHTAQHMLSAGAVKVLDAATVSVHFGSDFSTLDLRINDLTWEKIHQLEVFVNEKIYQDLAINIKWARDRDELKNFPIRRPTKTQENIRIVLIEDMDCAACGGTHLSRTGEVGIVKIRKWGKIRDCTRLEFVCGLNAIKDYQLKNRTVVTLSDIFTTKDADLLDSVLNLMDESKEDKSKIRALKGQLLDMEADELMTKSEKINGVRVIKKIFEDRENYDVKKLASILTKIEDNIILFGNYDQRSSLLFARSQNVDIDMNHLLRGNLHQINGKGGGRSDYAQGGGEGEGLKEAINAAQKSVFNQLEKLN